MSPGWLEVGRKRGRLHRGWEESVEQGIRWENVEDILDGLDAWRKSRKEGMGDRVMHAVVIRLVLKQGRRR